MSCAVAYSWSARQGSSRADDADHESLALCKTAPLLAMGEWTLQYLRTCQMRGQSSSHGWRRMQSSGPGLVQDLGDHCHVRMTMQALPGSTLEVIETEFFFQLLVSLLANPSRLDGGRQGATDKTHIGDCRKRGEGFEFLGYGV